MQKDVKRVTREVVEHLKRGMTTEKLQGLCLKLPKAAQSHGWFSGGVLQEFQGNMQKILQFTRDGSHGSAAFEAGFLEAILQFVQHADDLDTCVGYFEPVGRYLTGLLRNAIEYESHLLSHLIRCLHQSTELQQQQRLYQQTLAKLLPCKRVLDGDQSLHAYAVGDMRWTLVSETTRDLHVYAACPEDMLEALKSHTPRSDHGNSMAYLTFDVSNDWWKGFHFQAEVDGIVSLLREMDQKYGRFLALRVACSESRVLTGFLKCTMTPSEAELLPRCLIISGGQVYLDALKNWLSACPETLLIWMDNLTIQLPKHMVTDHPHVDTDLRKAIPGLLTSPTYVSVT